MAVIGIVFTEERNAQGPGLEWVDEDGNFFEEEEEAINILESHSAYNFSSHLIGGNYFVKVPITYWKRSIIDNEESENNGKFCIWMSEESGAEVPLDDDGEPIYELDPETEEPIIPTANYTANPGAFSGTWLNEDYFYIGKYRASKGDAETPESKPNKDHWVGLSFNEWGDIISSKLGSGYHMLSIFEWHEILMRMVMETKSFELLPVYKRKSKSLCRWHGIEELMYMGKTQAIWLNGLKVDSSGKYSTWSTKGGSYNSTSGEPLYGSGESWFTGSLLSGGPNNIFNHIILPGSLKNIDNCLIEDLSGKKEYASNKVCHSYFYPGPLDFGSLFASFYFDAEDRRAEIGAVIAKW